MLPETPTDIARDGHHLFTLLVSLRALQAGANLASRLNDTGAADFYLEQSAKIVHRLSDFWDDSHSYYRATLPDAPPETDQVRIGSFTRKERTSLDCAVPLAILHAGDAAGGRWSAADDRILGTLRAWVLSFDGVYGINKGKKWTEGWAVGRYAEDVYNGIGTSKGNPW
jgi:glucoamylase